MRIKCSDNFMINSKNNEIMSSIYLKDVKNKRITILVRKGERCIKTKNKATQLDYRGFKNRSFLHICDCDRCAVEFIPTNLKKSRVYVESLESEKLRNILSDKFRRINN